MYTKAVAATAILLSEKAGLPLKDVIAFTDGLIFGLIQKNDFEALNTCLTDAQDLAEDIQQALAHFAKKDLFDILEGIKDIGKALSDLEKDVGDCKAIKPDIDRIKAWAVIFKQPKKLMETIVTNTLVHGPQIYGDIAKMITDIGAHQMHNTGEDIADILVTAIGPIPEISVEDSLL